MTGHKKPGSKSNTLTAIINKLASLSRQIYILLASNAWTIPEKKQTGGLRTAALEFSIYLLYPWKFHKQKLYPWKFHVLTAISVSLIP